MDRSISCYDCGSSSSGGSSGGDSGGDSETVLNGLVGDLYYCNGSVVGIRIPYSDYVIAMHDLGDMTWSQADSATRNYTFCGNKSGILPQDTIVTVIQNHISEIQSYLRQNGGSELSDVIYWYNGYIYLNGTDYYGYYNPVTRSTFRDVESAVYRVRPVLYLNQV